MVLIINLKKVLEVLFRKFPILLEPASGLAILSNQLIKVGY